MSVNLLDNIKVSRVLGYHAAGTTDRKASIVDMQNYDGVVFVATFGTMTSSSKILLKVGSATTNDTSAMADTVATTGQKTSDGTDDVQLVLDVYRPAKRYLEAQITIADANALIEGIVAIQYKGSKMPVTQATATLASETFASPADA